jgi:hypothetical protein
MIVMLYIATALEIFGIFATLAAPKMEPEEVTAGGASFVGAMVTAQVIPLIWLLTTPHALMAKAAAWFLLATLTYGLGDLARTIHGVRKPRTPAGTYVRTMVNFLCLAAWVVIITTVV